MAFENFLHILAEGTYYVYFPVKSWRFLLSRDFRNATYEKWEEQRPMIVVQEVIGLFIGCVMSIAVLCWILYYFFVK